MVRTNTTPIVMAIARRTLILPFTAGASGLLTQTTRPFAGSYARASQAKDAAITPSATPWNRLKTISRMMLSGNFDMRLPGQQVMPMRRTKTAAMETPMSHELFMA